MASQRELTQQSTGGEPPDESPSGWKWVEGVRLFVMIVGFILVAIAPFFFPDHSPMRKLLRGIGAAMTAWGSHVFALIGKWWNRPRLSEVPPMEELHRTVGFVMGRLGLVLKTLAVDDGPDAQQLILVSIPRAGRVVLSRRAVEVMSPDELEFLLAFKLRAIKCSNLGAYAFLFLIPFVGAGVLAWLGTAHEAHWALLTAAGAIVVLSVPALVVIWHRIRYRRDPQPRILSIDPRIAESALTKMIKYSSDESSLMAEMAHDPVVKDRVRALRESLREQIPAGASEERDYE